MQDDLISRAAAIDAICEDGTRIERQGRYRMTMVERKQRDVDILENLPSAQRWIPVTERLPEKEGAYIVCTDNDGIMYTHFYSSSKRFSSTRLNNHIVAWMERPAPYRAEKGDE